MKGSPKSGVRRRKIITSLVGNKYGRLTVTGFSHYDDRDRVHWKCICECGTQRAIRADRIKDGRAKSCGCLQKEAAAATGHENRVHGLCGSSFYRIWTLLVDRCTNPQSHAFEDYGARGIRPCAFIRESAANLLEIIGPRPGDLTIDRKNNNIGYTCGKCHDCISNGWPMNLRWATMSQQARNKRTTVMVDGDEGRVPLIEWCEKRGIEYKLAHSRYNIGWPLERLGEPRQ